MWQIMHYSFDKRLVSVFIVEFLLDYISNIVEDLSIFQI